MVDWFIGTQEKFIAHKQRVIRFINKVIAQKTIIKKGIEDEKEIFELEHDIQEWHECLKILYKSIDFNRDMINERKREIRLRNNIINGNDDGDKESEITGNNSKKQHTDSRQNGRGICAGGTDNYFWTHKEWQNPFCPELNL